MFFSKISAATLLATLAAAGPIAARDDNNSAALESRQSSQSVTVCNSYGDGVCAGTCNSITLSVGTYASTPGTACWYRNDRADPQIVPGIIFCNGSGGTGKCAYSEGCEVYPDDFCKADGTESMGYDPAK